MGNSILQYQFLLPNSLNLLFLDVFPCWIWLFQHTYSRQDIVQSKPTFSNMICGDIWWLLFYQKYDVWRVWTRGSIFCMEVENKQQCAKVYCLHMYAIVIIYTEVTIKYQYVLNIWQEDKVRKVFVTSLL